MPFSCKMSVLEIYKLHSFRSHLFLTFCLLKDSLFNFTNRIGQCSSMSGTKFNVVYTLKTSSYLRQKHLKKSTLFNSEEMTLAAMVCLLSALRQTTLVNTCRDRTRQSLKSMKRIMKFMISRKLQLFNETCLDKCISIEKCQWPRGIRRIDWKSVCFFWRRVYVMYWFSFLFHAQPKNLSNNWGILASHKPLLVA